MLFKRYILIFSSVAAILFGSHMTATYAFSQLPPLLPCNGPCNSLSDQKMPPQYGKNRLSVGIDHNQTRVFTASPSPINWKCWFACP